LMISSDAHVVDVCEKCKFPLLHNPIRFHGLFSNKLQVDKWDTLAIASCAKVKRL
jgi:hypothetical protein